MGYGQPVGTVTLVFTDVEGSTDLLRALGDDRYRDAMAQYRRIVRDAFGRHGGYEVDSEGDAFFYAFETAQASVDAVSHAMPGLAESEIRIRVGIHTGEPRADASKYVGMDVHLAARIMSAAHGGQVLLSRATRELIRSETSHLGEHRLKDIGLPVSLFQLGSTAFPPLRTLSNTNLPVPASSFVGRQAELAAAAELLAKTRLLTVTGPGGTGKTRLAIELASRHVGRFPGGAFWVGLAALRDSGLVLDTIANALGARTTLANYIGDRHMLLILDNLEQVIDSAWQLSELLQACPHLTLLVTSRERLRIDGELEHILAPFTDPDAVSLFCDRAQTESNAAIGTLCRKLDNLPLAIELIAARSRILTPDQLLERLERRLDLASGSRDSDARQQTLRATIAWSHELLTPDERELFARLAVFAGGCTIDAAEEVCEANMDVLQSLAEKSLVHRIGERFWQLETIREYAAEQLALLSDASDVRRRQAHWLSRLARESEPALEGRADQAVWLTRLVDEADNFRAVLDWARDSDSPLMLDIVGHLGLYFWLSGFITEGRGYLDDALRLDGDMAAGNRADALHAAAWLASVQGDLSDARRHADACAALRRKLGDDRGLARALREQGKSRLPNEPEEARAFLEEAAGLSRRAGDEWNLAIVMNNLGDLALYGGDYEEALRSCRESLSLREARGDAWGATISGFNVGLALLELARWDEADRQLQKTLVACIDADRTMMIAETLVALAGVELARGRAQHAARLLGAADALLAETEERQMPLEASLRKRLYQRVESELSGGAFESAWSEGRSWGRHDIYRYSSRAGGARTA